MSCRWRDARGIERWRRKGEGKEERKQRARKTKERDRKRTAGTEIRRRKGEEKRERAVCALGVRGVEEGEGEGDRRTGKRERGKPGKEGERVVRAKGVMESG